MQSRDLTICHIALAELKPYVRNARTHSEAQVAQIAASMREFGWTNPVLVDGARGIIAGHGRVLAAEQLGLETVPCIELGDLSEAQARAYIIADNKLALNAGWDEPVLGRELLALDALGFDCTLTGFSGDELEGLFARAQSAGEGLADEDAVPEAQERIVSCTGDVWLCGRHRVRCGDSTKAEDVAALLAGVEPHLMVTDPPYGVKYDPDWRNRADRANGKLYGARAIGQVANDDRSDWREAWALFPGDVAYVWHAGRHASSVQASLEAVGLFIRCQIMWNKPRFTISRGDYHWQHEPCWYAVRKGKTGHWAGDRSQSTVWDIEHLKSETGHSTQKPVECMRRPIVNNSNPGQAVYDPFLGSGTTMIAAEKEARICYGMEIAPQYADVCVRRWQEFTGEEATLEGNGHTFAEIAAARLKEAA